MALSPNVAKALGVLQERGLDVYPAALGLCGDLNEGNQVIAERTIVAALREGNLAEAQAKVYSIGDFCMHAVLGAQRGKLN